MRGYAIALLGALLAAPVRTAAQQRQTIRINYVNADLSYVIRSLAAVLNVLAVLLRTHVITESPATLGEFVLVARFRS